MSCTKEVVNNLPPSTETPFPIGPRSSTQDASSSTTPSLPPAMDSVRSHTADEIIQMMKKTPLFMTDLDEAAGADGQAPEENIELEALRALQYEGTRAEVALGFKERGNEMVAEKKWKDAKEFYTKGIMALKQAPKSKPGTGNSVASDTEEEREAEKGKEKTIEEACYVNRALCNLELKNHRSTLHDTAQTLLLAPHNPKAHYRSSLALLALHKYNLALDTVARGLSLTSPSSNTTSNPSKEHLAFRTLETRILHEKSTAQAKEAVKAEAEERKKKEQVVLDAAMRARGIKIRMTAKPPEMEDARICLHPDPLNPASSQLYFPVLLLYPTAGQTDFVKRVQETETVNGLLETVLGGEEGALGWDTEGEFTVRGVRVFMETRAGGMVRVGGKVALGDVLGGGKVEVVDGVVRFFVVPRGRVEGWVGEMKGRGSAKA